MRWGWSWPRLDTPFEHARERRPALVTVLAFGLRAAFLMGIARVSSGAHYTTDVIGGWLLAAAILATWTLWPGSVLGRWAGAGEPSP